MLKITELVPLALSTACLLCVACRYPLALGWYVVRNPNQAALVRGTSSSMARQQEDAFFNSTHPWRGLPSSSRGRLGQCADLSNCMQQPGAPAGTLNLCRA